MSITEILLFQPGDLPRRFSWTLTWLVAMAGMFVIATVQSVATGLGVGWGAKIR